MNALVAAILTAGGTLTSPLLVLSPALAVSIALTATSGGGVFGGVGYNGGMLYGMPVMTTTNMPAGQVVLFDQAEVLLAATAAFRLMFLPKQPWN